MKRWVWVFAKFKVFLEIKNKVSSLDPTVNKVDRKLCLQLACNGNALSGPARPKPHGAGRGLEGEVPAEGTASTVALRQGCTW